MNKNDILAAQQRVISQEKAATCLTLKSLKGTGKEYETAAAIENANHPDAQQTVREWQIQVEPGVLKQVERKEVLTAYT